MFNLPLGSQIAVVLRANKLATDATNSIRTIAKQNEEIIRLNKLLVTQQTPPKTTGPQCYIPTLSEWQHDAQAARFKADADASNADNDSEYWIARYKAGTASEHKVPKYLAQRNKVIANWVGALAAFIGIALFVVLSKVFNGS